MKVIETIKKGFATTTSSFGLVMVLFVFGAFWNILNILIAARMDPNSPQTAMIMLVIGSFFILSSIFVQAGSLGYVREKVKIGQATFAAFISAGSKYYVRLLLLGLLVAAAVGLLVLVAVLLISLLAANLDILGIIIGLFFAALGIYIALLVFLAPYSIVAGEQKVIASIKQSVSLVRQNILSVLGIILLMILIGFTLGLILGVIFALLSTAMQGVVPQIIFSVLSSFVNAFLGVIVTASFMTYYLSVANNNTSA